MSLQTKLKTSITEKSINGVTQIDYMALAGRNKKKVPSVER